MASPGHHPHHHDVHLDEGHWQSWAGHSELEGEVLLGFVTEAAAWVAQLRDLDAPALWRVLDIGCGPGVGTCELARRFPQASVVAVDASPAMLERAGQRAAAEGLDDRISTHLAELPGPLDGLEGADLIWASMSLHHVGDEVAALRLLGGLLAPGGLLAVAEMADPMRVLPDDLGRGRPGLADRLASAGASWFADMRAGLPGSVPSRDLPTMVEAAGLEVVGFRVARQRFDPPLGDAARRLAVGQVQRARDQLGDRLDDDDLQTIAVLADPDDPGGVHNRQDLFVSASRQIVIARPRQGH